MHVMVVRETEEEVLVLHGERVPYQDRSGVIAAVYTTPGEAGSVQYQRMHREQLRSLINVYVQSVRFAEHNPMLRFVQASGVPYPLSLRVCSAAARPSPSPRCAPPDVPSGDPGAQFISLLFLRVCSNLQRRGLPARRATISIAPFTTNTSSNARALH